MHTIVSSISAVVMLLLAFLLRFQQVRPHRHTVAQARPILQAYGVVPSNDSHDESASFMSPQAEEPRQPQSIPPIAVAVGHRVDVIGLGAAASAMGIQLQPTVEQNAAPAALITTTTASA
uniref:Uncharacterized protein n=1 Tax=Haptolina brevifila TaxID=156173 RepID=A0A7S2I8Y8_9EUKA|mmetsp:Transcript_63068/g.124668  ORF Transcript_63068/g.124668 Transcript_63068/m.124668 type:complete len:120 (+) Transcript_63068:290-649(+)